MAQKSIQSSKKKFDFPYLYVHFCVQFYIKCITDISHIQLCSRSTASKYHLDDPLGEELYKHICFRSNPFHIYIITCLLYAVQRDLK